jgi:HAD superfamily hydrolase (TIGR01549 family)
MPFKAIIFDYIGTLVNCGNYTMDDSRHKLYMALTFEGLRVPEYKFLAAYITAHEKYRVVRYEQLKEVTNAVWVAEALNNLGIKVAADDFRVKAALNAFFQDYIDTLTVRDDAKKLLRQAEQQCKVGLISNFTHAPVIYSSLRKLGLNGYFSAVVVSEQVGWRKPSIRIFQDALNRLHVKAEEAIFIGDSPIEDIKGAREAGLKTIFVPSQFNTLEDLAASRVEPDYVAKDIPAIMELLVKIHG